MSGVILIYQLKQDVLAEVSCSQNFTPFPNIDTLACVIKTIDFVSKFLIILVTLN